jgi:hypothetical protein
MEEEKEGLTERKSRRNGEGNLLKKETSVVSAVHCFGETGAQSKGK